MDPEKRIRSSLLPPAVIEDLLQVFHQVWGDIGHNFISERAADDVRDRLARIILAYAIDESLDAATVKSTAKLVMAMNFPGITLKGR